MADASTSDDGEAIDVSDYAIEPDCSREELLAVSKVYARDVVAQYGLTVDVSGLEWSVSVRAKRRAGAVQYRDGEPQSVVLTWGQFENRGWEATAATVRHELIHVHLLNESGDASHGPPFKRLAERLSTHVRCDRFTPPKWWVTCTDCGHRLARYRRSKLVANPERYECGDCGGRFEVERNDP